MPARQIDEGIGVDLDQGRNIVGKRRISLKLSSTREFNGQQVRIDIDHGAVDQLQHLVDQVYTPVEQHATASDFSQRQSPGMPLEPWTRDSM